MVLTNCATERPSSSKELNSEDFKMVIEKLSRILTECYVLPDAAEKCINTIGKSFFNHNEILMKLLLIVNKLLEY